jgi:hypothetical protein
VIIALADAALSELEQVLDSGCVSMERVRVVYDSLPGRAICAATVADGLLWLVLDLDKPSAPRHARAMILDAQGSEHAQEVCEAIKARAPLALVV